MALVFASRLATQKVQVSNALVRTDPLGNRFTARSAKYIEFKEGIYKPQSRKLAEALLFHPEYGRLFWSSVPKEATYDDSWKELVEKAFSSKGEIAAEGSKTPAQLSQIATKAAQAETKPIVIHGARTSGLETLSGSPVKVNVEEILKKQGKSDKLSKESVSVGTGT